jgi:transcriptional regulator with XRE-family HTH domain
MENLKIFRKFFNITQNDLANILSLKIQTIQGYESGSLIPSFKTLMKLIDYFNITLDYFIFFDKCNYPKNLKLLKLAKRLDDFTKSDSRNNIESTIKNLLGNKITNKIKIKQDIIDIEISNNFFNNLKTIRNYKNFSQIDLSKELNVTRSAIASYETRNYPPINKLIKLSEIFNISIHFLTTGEKLVFEFNDKYFGETIHLADQLLSFEHQKFLIELMENIINEKK